MAYLMAFSPTTADRFLCSDGLHHLKEFMIMTGVYILRLIPSSAVPTYYVCVESKDKTASIFATTTFLHVAKAKAKTISTMSGKPHTTPTADLELWDKLDAPKPTQTGGMFDIKAVANG